MWGSLRSAKCTDTDFDGSCDTCRRNEVVEVEFEVDMEGGMEGSTEGSIDMDIE